MTDQDIKKSIKDFLSTNILCVVSSINSAGLPQSATVAFSEDENFNIVIGTALSSRKAQNILANPNVSLVVTNQDVLTTVQLEGTASLLEGKELEKYQNIHFAKNPYSAKLKDKPDQCWILIKPNWLRITNIKEAPWRIEEIKL
jgi:general stress protein 26